MTQVDFLSKENADLFLNICLPLLISKQVGTRLDPFLEGPVQPYVDAATDCGMRVEEIESGFLLHGPGFIVMNAANSREIIEGSVEAMNKTFMEYALKAPCLIDWSSNKI